MSPTKRVTATLCRCTRCDHQWVARVPQPGRCAKCRTPYWNKEVERHGVSAAVKATRKKEKDLVAMKHFN